MEKTGNFTYVFFPFGFGERSCADRGLGSRVLLVHRVLHMEVISFMRLAPVQPQSSLSIAEAPTLSHGALIPMTGGRFSLGEGFTVGWSLF